MKYVLLKEYYTDEPREFLLFTDDVDLRKVQSRVHELKTYFFEHEDDETFDWDGANCEEEWMMNKLCDEFYFEVIPWSNDDVLYN